MRVAILLLAAALVWAGEPPIPPMASWSAVVKKAAPSVVTVFTTKEIKRERMMLPFGDDPMFRRFFPNLPDADGEPLRQRGLGSGVVVSADGLVLTNHHVIEGAEDIRVAVERGHREYPAKVVGSDARTDLAVLRLEGAKDLVPIAWGDSDRIAIGDPVLAIGNPFGVGQTVTAGIISARGRALGMIDYEDHLQTDAAINQGNSGGALVDADGRLVGVNTAILSPSGTNLGIGFAVPARLARQIMDALVKGGKVVRGYLGLAIQPVTADVARAFKLGDQAGALVGDVVAGSPADQAGVKAGDVVTGFGTVKVDDARHLRLLAADTAPGSKVPLTLLREGKSLTVEVTLREQPAAMARGGDDDEGGARGEGERARLGVTTVPLEDALRRRLDAPASVDGVVVQRVMPGSRAAEAGIKPGEVIIEAGRKPVRSPSDLTAAVRAAESDLVLRMWSREGLRYVVVPLGGRK
jgi:serine protease Do